MNENITLWGLVVAGLFALGPVLKEFIKFYLSNKVNFNKELDSVKVLEEKNKILERDETLSFLKQYLERKDKEFETLKDILHEVKVAVQESQFTDKKDFQTIVLSKTELMLLKIQRNISFIIERNHISKQNLETSHRKIANLIEKEISNLILDISEVHFHQLAKNAIIDIVALKKENMLSILNSIIDDYVEDVDVIEQEIRKENALKELQEGINYLLNSFNSSFLNTKL